MLLDKRKTQDKPKSLILGPMSKLACPAFSLLSCFENALYWLVALCNAFGIQGKSNTKIKPGILDPMPKLAFPTSPLCFGFTWKCPVVVGGPLQCFWIQGKKDFGIEPGILDPMSKLAPSRLFLFVCVWKCLHVWWASAMLLDKGGHKTNQKH